MSRRYPSFALLLPIGIPLLCLTALSAIFTVNYLSLAEKAGKDDSVWIHDKTSDIKIPRHAFVQVAIVRTAWMASRPIQSVNFPSMATELAVSGVMRTFPDSYRPAYFGDLPDDLFVWRGIIFPVYCIPFWWFVGFGIDAALKRRHLKWPVALLGTLLSGFFVFITIGMVCTMSRPSHEDDNAFVWCGFALWDTLLATFPYAWIRQWRSKTKPSPDPTVAIVDA